MGVDDAKVETSVKRISELPGVVYFEIEERHFRGDTVSVVSSLTVFEFDDDSKIRRLRVYLQQPRDATIFSPVGRGTVGPAAAAAPKRLVVETHDEGVRDRTADGGDEHRRLHAALGADVVADQQGPNTVHDVAEHLVLGEEPGDHGIAQDGAHRVPAVDGEIDDALDEGVAASRRGGFALGGVDDRRHPRQLGFRGRQHDLVLGGVLVVHRRLRHADLVGDHLQRRPTDAVLREQPDRRGDDAGLGRARRDQRLAGLARSSRRSRCDATRGPVLSSRSASGASPAWAHRRRSCEADQRAKEFGCAPQMGERPWLAGGQPCRGSARGTKRAVLRAVAVAFVAVIALDQAGCEPRPDVLIGAGDIAECGKTGDSLTAGLVTNISGEVVTFGDLAYEDGTAREFRDCYGPTWGQQRLADRTRRRATTSTTPPGPTGTSTTSARRAGPDRRGIYHFDKGGLAHLLAEQPGATSPPERPMCGPTPGGGGASPAYWHKPLRSSGRHGSTGAVAPLWRALYDVGGDLGAQRARPRPTSGSPSSVGPDCPECRWHAARSSSAPVAPGTTPSVRPAARLAGAEQHLVRGDRGPDCGRPPSDGTSGPIAGHTFTDSGTGAC